MTVAFLFIPAFTRLHARAKSSNTGATTAAATMSTVKTEPLAHPHEAYLD